MAIVNNRPPHKHYALAKLDDATYFRLADSYSCVKRTGIGGIYAWVTGEGILVIISNIAKYTITYFRKGRIVAGINVAASWVCTPIFPALTNATVILKAAKRVHSAVSILVEHVFMSA